MCTLVCFYITLIANSHTIGTIQQFKSYSLDLEGLRVYYTETPMFVVDIDREENLIHLFQVLPNQHQHHVSLTVTHPDSPRIVAPFSRQDHSKGKMSTHLSEHTHTGRQHIKSCSFSTHLPPGPSFDPVITVSISWICRIFIRPFRSGNGTTTCRSKRPGRVNAPSRMSPRFVAAITIT